MLVSSRCKRLWRLTNNLGKLRTPGITHLTERNLTSLGRAAVKRASTKKEAIYQDGRRIVLTEEQRFILDKVLHDKTSLFFTGSAGTGKSILLREVIQRLRKNMSDPARLQVTASTGIAALNIGGNTLHSFAGIGLGELPIQESLAKIRGNKAAYYRWLATEVLVIDEISMLVVSGDFFQLPPVPEERDIYTGRKMEPQYAFEAKCWNATFPKAYKLTRVFRQANTSKLKAQQYTYQSIDKCGTDRYGCPVRISDAEAMLEKRAPKDLVLRVGAQVMCTQNIRDSSLVNGSIGRIVDFITPEQALAEGYPIAGATISISDAGIPQRPLIKKHFQEKLWPLVRFAHSGEFLIPPVDFTLDNGVGGTRARRCQVPLILAWALTIHRAQGQTIDRLKVDLARTFAPGQAYVAISRCKSLDGLQVLNFSRSSVFVSKKVIDWDNALSTAPMA